MDGWVEWSAPLGAAYLSFYDIIKGNEGNKWT